MSRTTSLTFRQAVNAQETAEVFLILLTLEHDDLSEPMRFTSDKVDTISRGNTYISFPMDISLPDDQAESVPQVSITIDNVDRRIIQTIRTISSPPRVAIEVILASDPDTVEAAFSNFSFRDITADALVVSGTLTVEDFTAEPFPGDTMNPSNFPGLF